MEPLNEHSCGHCEQVREMSARSQARAEAEAKRIEDISEANGEALTGMLNEAREDAIELAKALRECMAAFEAIRDSAHVPGVGLPGYVAAVIRIAWAQAATALAGHVEANRNSGWDSSTWPELGR